MVSQSFNIAFLHTFVKQKISFRGSLMKKHYPQLKEITEIKGIRFVALHQGFAIFKITQKMLKLWTVIIPDILRRRENICRLNVHAKREHGKLSCKLSLIVCKRNERKP